ncbi:site-specific integrase [Amycolatopsis sp. FDAARGOS 1241]|uniref:site-specific integrase n=1 Tax=Amycolatopsis sp. FDAARGOS 1241 TaxID=2778070 RepID=UPI00194DFFF9|nr:site-specific integrase [Amycolatopsis sp. FDAARGOS 1241]QRP45785.1 site-specific integrase [Amycolatopsis sp. FDAARGOS 1241]
MAAKGAVEGGRQRGSIRRHRDNFQVRVSAGKDPVTGERIVLTDSVAIERPGNERSERAAWKEAEKVRTRLQGEADSLKVARTKSTFGALLDQWLPQAEIDPTTRMNYEWMIRDHIRPVLGDVPLVLLLRDASERLERFYGDLRRCRKRCDGRPFVEHRTAEPHECRIVRHQRPSGRPSSSWLDEHDCAAAECAVIECRQHKCQPYSASSVRSFHAIISGALSAAVRWNRIPYNPAPAVKLPAKRKPQPRPPSSHDMARIIEAAHESSAEWGTYVWLSAVTGARRGEVVALQWEDIDFAVGKVRLDENFVRGPDGLIIKDTKTHQWRRVSLDPETLVLLQQHKDATVEQLASLRLALTGKTWLFSAQPDFSKPRDPSALTRKYKKLVAALGVETQLKELRHYSATELLTSGTDLRTVAGRLGHGDGTTTLRHYAAWVGAADEAAAATIGSKMPRLHRRPERTPETRRGIS